MEDMDLELIVEITLRTLWVCGCALLAALSIGIPIGIALGSRRFRGRSLAVSTVNQDGQEVCKGDASARIDP